MKKDINRIVSFMAIVLVFIVWGNLTDSPEGFANSINYFGFLSLLIAAVKLVFTIKR